MIDPAQLAALGGAVSLGGMFAHSLFCGMADFEPDHGDVHGAARAATLDEALAAGLSTDWEKGLFLGVWDQPVKNRFGYQTVKRHMLSYPGPMSALLIAPSRSGKLINLIRSTLLAIRKESVILYDPKGEGTKIAFESLRRRGYKTAVFNPMNVLPGMLGPSASTNPLGDLATLPPSAIEEPVRTQTATLVAKTGAETNPFFINAARGLVTGVALFLLETLRDKASWPLVFDFLIDGLESQNKMFDAMRRSRFPSVRAIGTEWHMTTDANGKLVLRDTALNNVMSTARTEMEFLGDAAMRRLFGSSSFSFSNLKRPGEKWAVSIVFPEGGSKATPKATELLVNAAKNALLCAPKVPVLMMLDELCTSLPPSAAPMIETLFNLGAGFGLRVLGVGQSIGQFQTWAGNPAKAAAIRAGAGAMIFYGANDPVTNAAIRAEIADNRTIWAPSTNPLAGLGIDGASTGAMAVPLLRDSDLRDMLGYGTQLIMMSGSGKPVILPRTPYFKIPILQARASENPYFTEGK